MLENTSNALVLGASGAIGQALVRNFLDDGRINQVVAISRSGAKIQHPRLHWIQTEYKEADMAATIDSLAELKGSFSKVGICHGILHDQQMFPEKRMEDISVEMMQAIFHANTVVPSLWLKLLRKTLAGAIDCKVACFSARVGSTGDNRLGGWYSYRASKAALNSIMKTFSIEYARRAKNIKLIAFHPGTVNSAMSKPFHATVPEGKLFEPDYVATCLSQVMDEMAIDGQLSYVDYAGKPIPW
jgi:NAD(P)-dependent dehydrogenase (short-subunit alcohol dehydrogenase family)